VWDLESERSLVQRGQSAGERGTSSSSRPRGRCGSRTTSRNESTLNSVVALKWAGYQRIASLTDYLLVAQAEPRIEHYRRNADGSWTYRTAGPGEHLALTGGGTFAVDAIYADVFELPGE
jgi:hypothetical protein